MKKKRKFERRKVKAKIGDDLSTVVFNAIDLLEDAELLLKNKRYPRALSLAVLAIEEIGKINLIRTYNLKSGFNIKKFIQYFRNHKVKGGHALRFADLKLEQKIEKVIRLHFPKEVRDRVIAEILALPGLKSSKISPTDLDDLKQAGFYSDIRKDFKIKSPKEIINYGIARAMISRAKWIIEKEINMILDREKN